MKMKKLLLLISAVSLTALSIVAPVSAATYSDSSFDNFDRYFAVIPWREIEIHDQGDVFYMDAFGSFLDVASEFDTLESPVFSPVVGEQLGFQYDPDASDANGVPTSLAFTYEQSFSGEVQGYQRGTNYFEFQRDGYDLQNFNFYVWAKDFTLSKMEYSFLSSVSYIHLPANVICDVSVTVGYYVLNEDGSSWDYKTGTARKTVGDQLGGSYSYMPGINALFDVTALSPVERFVVSFLSVDLKFAGAPGKFGMDMLYGDEPVSVGALMSSKVATVYQDKIVEVPASDLDLYSWIIGPLGKFFEISFFPGITLGGLIGVGLGVTFLLIYLKWFGGGGT